MSMPAVSRLSKPRPRAAPERSSLDQQEKISSRSARLFSLDLLEVHVRDEQILVRRAGEAELHIAVTAVKFAVSDRPAAELGRDLFSRVDPEALNVVLAVAAQGSGMGLHPRRGDV